MTFWRGLERLTQDRFATTGRGCPDMTTGGGPSRPPSSLPDYFTFPELFVRLQSE